MPDLEAIRRLHQQDVAATLSRNPRALAELWTKDAVRMEPHGPAEVGKRTIYANDSTRHARAPRTQIIRYVPSIIDIQIVGDWAIEWGHFDGAYKQSPTDSLHVISGNLLRVLRRHTIGPANFWTDYHDLRARVIAGTCGPYEPDEVLYRFSHQWSAADCRSEVPLDVGYAPTIAN